MKKVKGLVLFSGGLDSILAAKILMEQGIKITALAFKSYFFNEEQAKRAARELKIFLKVIDFSKEHLAIVKSPKYGYGSAMNPCIDCHSLMLKKAKQWAKTNRFDFVATGEVLGERPMSQNKVALRIVELESGLRGYLLRPLSAKILSPTIPEKKGWVNREKLLDISGRSRKRQIELARKFKIKYYPTPAGGCLLTDPEFAKKLKELLERYSQFQKNDVELLKLGRHFWPSFSSKIKIIIGRNQAENDKIKQLVKKNDILIEMKNYPGPVTLIRNYSRRQISSRDLKLAERLTQSYSNKARTAGKNNIKWTIIFSK